MFKKTLFAFTLAALVVLASVGSALAAPGTPQEGLSDERIRRSIGQITAISEDQITVDTPTGELTLLIGENTQFKDREGEELGIGDLAVGDWVVGSAYSDDDGEWVAKVVILLPDDFEPSDIPGRKLRGRVVAVDLANQSFDIETQHDEVLTIGVDEHTRYAGVIGGLEDLEEGMPVGVSVKLGDDGSLLALVVLAGRPDRPLRQRWGGQVEDVDTAASTFTILTRQDEVITFQVDEYTQFRSPDGEVEALSDLEPGMVVVVSAVEQSGDELLALLVIAAEPATLEGERARGTVTSVGSTSFWIENNDGEVLIFQVDGDTRFLSRGSTISGLEDLEVGMPVGVKYETQEDGSLLAKAVVVLMLHPESE